MDIKVSQPSLFDIENKLAQLSAMGDPLEKLNHVINWALFRPVLHRALHKERSSNAGRPAYDVVMMFKILLLQTMYNLSDAQTQYQIIDRHSFKRFLGIVDENKIPDEKTIWLFRERLSNAGVIQKLFNQFDTYLADSGFVAKRGQIIDASFVEVPRQRNTREENESIRNGTVPAQWDKPAKMRQKDTDARWASKNKEQHYGYKNHINVDVKNKLVRTYEVTAANVHDSQQLENLLNDKNTGRGVWADSAYRSEEIEGILTEAGLKSHVHRKANRGKPLSECQKRCNKKKSRIRARVEHVFGWLEGQAGSFIRCIGQKRAETKIGLMNLTYNLNRYRYLVSVK